MSLSLYELSVPTYLQSIRAMGGFMDKAIAHCAETGGDPDDLAKVKLYPDMAPFHFQVEAAWHHSVWGVEALVTGEFTPPGLEWDVPFARLRAMIAEGERQLMAFQRDEIDACAGKRLDMQIGPRRLEFTAESFILSFSLPNFHFHAVTAYDILRSQGVPIGKRDYEGVLRTLSPPIET